MSYSRDEPGQPSGLLDDSPHRGKPGLVEPQPFVEKAIERGKWVVKKNLKQCKSCTLPYDEKLQKCPYCQCPDAKPRQAKQPIDIIPHKMIDHLGIGLKFCWNQSETAEGEINKHQFDEVKIPVISVIPIMVGGTPTTSYEIHDEVRCKQCSMPYQRINGRGATDEEIAQFKAGKIEKASKFLGQNWSE